MKKIFGIVALVITVIGLLFGAAKEIEWTVYLGIPLMALFGGVGAGFVTKRIEGVVSGLVLGAFLGAILTTL
jgi:hypothetical protein